MTEVREINFGIQKVSSFSFGTAYINTVMRLNKYEHIVTTSKEVLRIENGIVKSRCACQVSAAIYCKEYDALITVSPTHSEFTVFFPSVSMKEPVFQGMKLDQVGVYHILFDKRTATIITIGQGVKTWYLNCLLKKERRTLFDNRMTIEPRASFGVSYSASMITVPSYDASKGIIYLPTASGLQCFDLDGEVQPQPVKFPGDVLSMFAVNPFNGNMLSSDRDDSKQDRLAKYRPPESHEGICYWSKKGVLRARIPFTNSSLFAAFFVNKEFVVGLDAALFVHIVDLKTLKFYPMFQLGARPTRVFFEIFQDQPRLYVVTNNEFSTYMVRVPWRLWYKAPTAPLKMARCPRYKHAARILMQLSDASFHFVQPVTASILTTCHSKNLARPVNYYADRGIAGVHERDQLFVVLDSGTVEVFAAHENPCKPSMSIDMKATCCCVCNIFGTDAILFSTKIGDIMVYKYDGMTLMKRLQICQDRILFVHAFQSLGVIIAVICNKFYMLSMKDGTIMHEIKQDANEVTAFFHDIFAVGYDNGALSIRRILEDGTELLHNPQAVEHQGKVTAISAGSSFFVTTGEDGSVMVWNLNAERLAILRFPTRIFSCCVQNGFRNILLGTDSAVMIVEGSLLFGKEIDPEDVDMDNYDRIHDKLCFNLEFFRLKSAEQQARLPAEEPPAAEEKDEIRKAPTPVQVKEPEGKPTKKNRFAEMLKANRELRDQRLKGSEGSKTGAGTASNASGQVNEAEARKMEIVKQMSLETVKESDIARAAPSNHSQADVEEEVIEEVIEEYDDDEAPSIAKDTHSERAQTAAPETKKAVKTPETAKPPKTTESKERTEGKEAKRAKEKSQDAASKQKPKGGTQDVQKERTPKSKPEAEDGKSTNKTKAGAKTEKKASTEKPKETAKTGKSGDKEKGAKRNVRHNDENSEAQLTSPRSEKSSPRQSHRTESERSEKSSPRQSHRTESERSEKIVEEHMEKIGATEKKARKTKAKSTKESSAHNRTETQSKDKKKASQSDSETKSPDQQDDNAYTRSDDEKRYSRTRGNDDEPPEKRTTKKKSRRGRVAAKSIDNNTSPSKITLMEKTGGLQRSSSQDSLRAAKERMDPRSCTTESPNRTIKPPNYDYLGTSGRNRTSYNYQKETINPDIDLRSTNHPPALFFDMSALSGAIGDENIDKYQNLSCFLQIPDTERLAQGRAKHFCLASPRRVEGWESGTQTELNTTIQMFQLKKDPPPLQEEPEFVNRPKDARSRLPPLVLDVVYRNRETTYCDARPMSYRIASARMKETKPTTSFPYQDPTCFTGRSIGRSKTPVRIVNPGQNKQNMRNLAAIFSRVKRK